MTENEFSAHAQAIMGALSDETEAADLTYHAEKAGMLAADIVRRLSALSTHPSRVVQEGVEIGLFATAFDEALHQALEIAAELRTEVDRLRGEVRRRDEQILKLSTEISPTSEPAEKLIAELMAEARQTPTTSRKLVQARPARDAATDAEKLVAELTAAAPADIVLHRWTDEREHAEEVHGRLSPQWAEVWSRGVSGTCMLPHGHDGPHQFTPDVTFAPANPHPSGCHTESPGTRDCDSDGNESCSSCSRRKP